MIIKSPSTYTEWLEALKKVKQLYQKCEYKECAQQSYALLQTPQAHAVHTAYLNFYAGLCYELMAEPLNDLSISKVDYLNWAEDYLTAAIHALPRESNAATASQVRKEPTSLPKAAVKSLVTNEDDPFIELCQYTSLDSPPGSSTLASSQRFADNIKSFSDQLQAQRKWISHAKRDVLAKRTRNYQSRVPEKDLEKVKAAEKRKQIADGKSRAWRRKRFDATRTQNLCETALAEV